MTSKLDLLTHHEAGHAAVAFHFGLRLKAVRVNQIERKGETRRVEGQQPTRFQLAMVLLAGSRAERMFDPASEDHSILGVKDDDDTKFIIEERRYRRLLFHTPEEADGVTCRLRARLATRCERIVRDMWPAIQRLAAVLAEKRYLPGEEAEAILAGKDA